MTIRLSAMFEEHMRRILLNWKSARRRNNNKKKKTKAKGKKKPKKKPNLSNGTGKFLLLHRVSIMIKCNFVLTLFYVQDLPNQNLLPAMRKI